jgi:short-subunit dehydrogenase
MVTIGIFGSSGEIGQSVANQSKREKLNIKQLSRSFLEKNENSYWADTEIVNEIDAYLFCNGKFTISPLVEFSKKSVEEEINANLMFQIQATSRILKHINHQRSLINFVYLGSTSAYNGFANSSVYCAAKFGLRGFVESMNAEYKNTPIRFSLFSFGTVNNRMGLQIVDQNSETFLPMELLSKEILSHVINFTNLFQPEIIYRRRVIE